MSERNRRAYPTLFGFDFQTNAAIYLMIDKIFELEQIRIEGNHEDIELKLADGSYILGQAKSIVKGSSDYKNVIKNLEKALVTLSEGSISTNCKELILVTNSYNPLNNELSLKIFGGTPTRRAFSDLPQTDQDRIIAITKKLNVSIEIEKFVIQTIPFETDDDKERYKFIRSEVQRFLDNYVEGANGITDKLLRLWQDKLTKNGTKSKASIKISKKELILQILILLTDINSYDDDYINSFDIDLYDDIKEKYSEIIEYSCSLFEIYTKILTEFSKYQSHSNINKKRIQFIEEKWELFADNFRLENMDPYIVEGLTKIIMYSVIRRQRKFQTISRTFQI